MRNSFTPGLAWLLFIALAAGLVGWMVLTAATTDFNPGQSYGYGETQ